MELTLGDHLTSYGIYVLLEDGNAQAKKTRTFLSALTILNRLLTY